MLRSFWKSSSSLVDMAVDRKKDAFLRWLLNQNSRVAEMQGKVNLMVFQFCHGDTEAQRINLTL
jgi:hypothetical protein